MEENYTHTSDISTLLSYKKLLILDAFMSVYGIPDI